MMPRIGKRIDFTTLFALSGYAFYSVYACMLFHSPTAISSVASFGSVLAFWFVVALLVGRVLGCALFLLFPSKHRAQRHAKEIMFGVSALAILGFVVVGMVLQFAATSGIGLVLPWLCLGAFIIGVADATVVLSLLACLTSFELRNVYRYLVLSNIVAVLVYYALTFLPEQGAYPLAVLFFFLALISSAFARKTFPSAKCEYSSPVFRGAISQLWRPILGVSILAFMAGLMLQISGREEVPLMAFQQSSVFSSLVMYALLLLFSFFVPKNINLNRIYQIAIPISAVSFLLLPLIWNSAGGIVNSFANLGYMLALLVLTCLVIDVVRDTAISPYLLLAMVYVSAYLAQLIGMLVGFFNASLFGRGTLALTAIALVAVYLLSIVSLALFKDRGFRTIDREAESASVVHVEDVQYKDACEAVSEKFDFTAREREIFRQLGQGNTIHAISERLYISESTVKYHVKSIYQKLGIHTRQELIDMITLSDARER